MEKSMQVSNPGVGMVVKSKAGRDAGRYFVVLKGADEGYVLIADGDLRKVAKPKRKKIKHLDIRMVSIPAVKAKLLAGEMPQDFEIREGLDALGLKYKARTTGYLKED